AALALHRHGDLLDPGHWRQARQTEPEVAFVQPGAIDELGRHRHLTVAELYRTSFATEAEDVEVVAVLGRVALPEERGGDELAGELLGQGLAVAWREAPA